MEVLRGLKEIRNKHRGSVLTIGNFDGLHVGHQKTLRRVLDEAHRLKSISMALTFEPHPAKVLAPERDVRILTPLKEKARLMGRFGIDAVLVIDFDRDFAKLAADEFIGDILVGRLGARMVIVGHNYAFGRGKKGNTELLRRRGRKFGFEVRVIRNARLHGEAVSSSRIRSYLSWGRVGEAAEFLGRPYMITGPVIKGAGRGGALLDTPTANISTPNEVIPKEGVYAALVGLEGRLYDAVANLGTNPTFNAAAMSYEVHILDFKGDLTGKTLRIYFIDRLRDERKFPDIKSLRLQIAKDIGRARETLKGGRYPEPV